MRWFRPSITDRDADRSGADVGAVAGSNFHPANRLYWMVSHLLAATGSAVCNR